MVFIKWKFLKTAILVFIQKIFLGHLLSDQSNNIKYAVEKGVMCVTKPKILMILLYLSYYIIINYRNSILATDIGDMASINFRLQESIFLNFWLKPSG